MNKIFKTCSLILALGSIISTSALATLLKNKEDNSSNSLIYVSAADENVDNYSLNITSPVTESSSYGTVIYEHNKFASIEFSNIKAGSGVGVISPNSTISKTSASYALKSIKVGFSGGTLILTTWYDEDDLVKNYYPLTSGQQASVRGNYWQITSEENEVSISYLTVNYGCSKKEARPDTSFSTLTVDADSGAFMYETPDGVLWCLTGTYKGDRKSVV